LTTIILAAELAHGTGIVRVLPGICEVRRWYASCWAGRRRCQLGRV